MRRERKWADHERARNISLPQGPGGRKDIVPTVRWPHQDQNPLEAEFELMQGLLAVTESGPNDGGEPRSRQESSQTAHIEIAGLIVLKGTHDRELNERFFAETGGIKPEQDSGDRN